MKLPPALTAPVLGTADPSRAIAQRAYLAAFFDQHPKGRPSPLLEGAAQGPLEGKIVD